MTVHLVHGIRAHDPENTMGALHTCLQQADVESTLVDYGYVLIPLDNARAKRAIRRRAEPGCTLVGYSNGGLAVHEVAARVQPRHVVLISPALERDAEWPDCIETVTVYYSNGDNAVGIGDWLADNAWLMPWRWGTPLGWGRMGIDGPATDDERVTSIMMGEDVAHSWFDYPEIVAAICQRIVKLETESPTG